MRESFIFGPGAPDTYASLQTKRKLMEQLAQGSTSAPRNLGEGLSALGRALQYRKLMGQVNTGEAEGRSKFESALGSIFSGRLGGGVAPQPGMGVSNGQPITASPLLDPNSPQGVARDAMTALGKGPMTPEAIKAGLIERGLPPHIADGFVMNFKDESGLNPGINEAAPTVPGSRGGYGLAQWTGPRRVALESFAAQNGKPASDPNVQMDFLMTELQGPESGAARSIFAAQDAPGAATAILNDFLRPAEEHRSARAAAYGGQSAPQGGGPSVPALIEALNNPYANEGEKMALSALLQQQIEGMQPPDPMDALALERAQLENEQLRNPAGPTPTDDMREYEFARSQGYQGTLQQFMIEGRRAGAPSTIINTGDPQVDAALAKTAMDPQTMLGSIEAVLQDPSLDRVVGPLEGSGGNDVDQLGVAKRMYYGGEGLATIQKIKQLQDTVFLGARQMLKGGGAITDYEGKKAEAAMGRLSRAQGEAEFRSALTDLKDAIRDGEAKLRAAGVMPAGQAPAGAPNGLSDDDLKYLDTP